MELTQARKARFVPRSGGRLLADALIAQGIDHVFAVPGESYLDVLDGLYAVREKLKLVTCRFEAGAVDMAEAYGKLTGRPAAAMVTRGPGACHGAIGVHIARQDSTPLLLFVGQIPFAETDRESFQEIDYRQMFGPLAKWVTQIDDARRIPELVAHAVDVATRGRPGPVVIALSEEMQRHIVEVPDIGPALVSAPHPDPAMFARLHGLLGRARKPLAILGGSCWSEAARGAMREFLHGHEIPVAVSFRRQHLYDATLANFVGDLGVGADPALVAKVREADLILAFGTRLSEAVTDGYTLFDLAGATPIVHVYPEPEEIGRVFRPALGICSDLNAFALALKGLPEISVRWRAWCGELRGLRAANSAVPAYKGPLNLAEILHQLQDMLPEHAILTSDAGNFAGWVSRFMNFADHQRFIGPTNGAMGYGVPAAIAAKLLAPDRLAVAFVGDGGFLMTGQEIATAFHHGVAPIVLVFNNQMYGTIRMHQEKFFPGRVSGTALTNPDFAKFIEAFGGHGETVSKTEEFAPAFERALASGKPAVIELVMDPEQVSSRATISELRASAALAVPKGGTSKAGMAKAGVAKRKLAPRLPPKRGTPR